MTALLSQLTAMLDGELGGESMLINTKLKMKMKPAPYLPTSVEVKFAASSRLDQCSTLD